MTREQFDPIFERLKRATEVPDDGRPGRRPNAPRHHHRLIWGRTLDHPDLAEKAVDLYLKHNPERTGVPHYREFEPFLRIATLHLSSWQAPAV